jgi:Tfp pilus assembly protein FimT
MRRSHMNNPDRLRITGYSFVELMLILLIVGIFAALAVPYLSQASASRLPAAMRQLEADLAYAQTYSITHHDTPCVVVFDTVNHSYHLAAQASPQTPLINPLDKQPYRITFGQGSAASLAGIRIKTLTVGDDNRLGFGHLGQLDQSAPAHITLTDGESDMTLRLDAITGLSSITQ